MSATMTGSTTGTPRHLSCFEWKSVPIGEGHNAFSRAQADALVKAAAAHPLGGRHGANILREYRGSLHARQVVGVLAAEDASLEILPKIDASDNDSRTMRARLVHMLDSALGLDLEPGEATAMARQEHSLLDVLIRLFADRLLGEVRRGLPRQYLAREDDLPALRGRLDVGAQFTRNAVRPDRLACRFDALEADTPLLRVMKACVAFLVPHARSAETQRRLNELRGRLVDIPAVPVARLPWDRVRIDRSNRRWAALLAMARLFLRREWQATHHERDAAQGVTLLFAMDKLFEGYVAEQLRRALADSDVEVVAQGGFRNCLGPWTAGVDCAGDVFRTMPDILLRRGKRTIAVIDTKWKLLSPDPQERKHGVSQADVYQLMAYARLYRCERLMLLYPATPGAGTAERTGFGMAGGHERLSIATLDIAGAERGDHGQVTRALAALVLEAGLRDDAARRVSLLPRAS